MRHWKGGLVTLVFALVLGVVLGAVSPRTEISLAVSQIEAGDLLN